ncbi:MAG: class I mannose-6-phosphate isomerase, partial [Clostridia bacterium]|nr:class I mannose-6-phosphate isomerase [Clostridia bacterium]
VFKWRFVMSSCKPVKLEYNRVWRLYFGGKLLDEFRGDSGSDGNFPEDWLASVVTANNPDRENKPENEGLSKAENGEYLRDIIESAPEMYLGKEHIEKHGCNFGVLTKFLDSAERLPAQVHPDKNAARNLFHSEFGKTEAWYILGGREINGEKPYILLGFKEDVTKERLKNLFDKQDIPAMSALMNKIPVNTGDVFLIEGGTPHAIGPGCFLIEIQEPTDYTISLESVTHSAKRCLIFFAIWDWASIKCLTVSTISDILLMKYQPDIKSSRELLNLKAPIFLLN